MKTILDYLAKRLDWAILIAFGFIFLIAKGILWIHYEVL